MVSLISQSLNFASFAYHGKNHFNRNGWLQNVLQNPNNLKRLEYLGEIDLTNQVYLITGGNSGCGWKVCEYLYWRGATVVMVCRSKERGEKAIQEIVQLQEQPQGFDRRQFQGLDLNVNSGGSRSSTFKRDTGSTKSTKGKKSTSSQSLSGSQQTSPVPNPQLQEGQATSTSEQTQQKLNSSDETQTTTDESTRYINGSIRGHFHLLPNVDCSKAESIRKDL